MSEQRHLLRMYRHMFYSAMLLLPSMLLMCSCGAVNAAKASGSQPIALFKVGETRLSASVGNEAASGDNDVKAFNGHSLVEVGGLMMALAKANFRRAGDPNVGMWEKHVSATGDGWARQVVAQDKTGWWTGIAVKQRGEAYCRSQLGGPKAVAKRNKIFLLLEHLRATCVRATASQATFDLELFVGTVGEPTAKGEPIVWSAGNLTNAAVTAHLKKEKWIKFWGSNGRGVLLRDGTIVFPLVAVKTNDKKEVCTIISSNDDGHTWNFPVKGFVEDCSDPNLFEWEGKLLMVATHATYRKKVHASSDVGETWTELGGMHSNVLSEAVKAAPSGGRVDILTASIEGRKVVLFTLHDQFDGMRKTNALHLYMTDMARFYPVGPISADGAVKTSGSLLYVNGELFALHEQQADKGAVVLTHLSAQLAEIKRVLRTWDAVDKEVALLCNSASKEEAAPSNACGTAALTAGLVGFLSSGGDNNNWVNEYLGLNASLTGAERADAGVVFKRTAAEGVWRVGNRWQNQRFHFVNDNFTLVATVVIQSRPSGAGPISLLGARGPGDAKLMELSYTPDHKWVTTFNAATNHVPDKTWELNKAYQLALVLHDGSGSMYADAQPLGSPVQLPMAGEAGRDVSEFYFLGTGNSQVAVRNVLLYNRPLTAAELQVFLQRDGQTGAGSQKREEGSPSTENSAAAASAEALGVDGAAASASGPRKETSSPSPAKAESGAGNTASGAAAPSPVKGIGDRAMRTRASAVLLLFLGLWGIAALC
ncbi:putative trans-sialidase [Trypanosoma rangeli]|uniref:Putative trans-sialidase n=1 Tax=Trypanosoma rangeli TaxID=5698 RepID=A0A422MWM5_TRYRA|nr:putative trans-sialidase [Trypanosoma rangeli]RNE97561.1 putative trans-sialidase [Trypanosoma rangeli]|eukprot:RNE97561.1 putative trans-sialidase [Trypanosoma rangeli]